MIVTRVYNNGDRVTTELPTRDGELEIAHNRDCRPGCAVFRDAECVQRGYLDAERCAAISEELRSKIMVPPATREELTVALFFRDGWIRLQSKRPRKSSLQTYDDMLVRRCTIANRRLGELLAKGPPK